MTSDKIDPGPDPDLLCIPLCSISREDYCTNHFTIVNENLLCAEHWGQELLPAEVSPQEWKDFLEQWQRSHQEYGGKSGRMWSRKWKCSEAWWNSGLAKMRHKAGKTGLASSRPLANSANIATSVVWWPGSAKVQQWGQDTHKDLPSVTGRAGALDQESEGLSPSRNSGIQKP